MNIKYKPMGTYQTNCFIVEVDNKELIIDPGISATKWVLENVKNPIAILNTHGHFDHVWSNKELKEKLNIPIYTPKEDVFMVKNDPFGQNTPPSTPDFEVKGDKELEISGIKVKFIHYPGHTPGCSAIEIGEAMFSGDFIFAASIGRVDFPYSNPDDMKESIEKFLHIEENWTIYTGHGEPTNVQTEQRTLPMWLNMI